MKKWLILSGITVTLIAVGIASLRLSNPLRSRERIEWKQKRIAEIAARVATPSWSSNELARLKNQGASASWLSEHIIATRNGEWLAYANVCRKEKEHVSDLFLARGSDGQWYYSTYHFCVGMVVLKMEEQPENLAAFTKSYFLRTFDGHSDDCLLKTWPPNSR